MTGKHPMRVSGTGPWYVLGGVEILGQKRRAVVKTTSMVASPPAETASASSAETQSMIDRRKWAGDVVGHGARRMATSGSESQPDTFWGMLVIRLVVGGDLMITLVGLWAPRAKSGRTRQSSSTESMATWTAEFERVPSGWRMGAVMPMSFGTAVLAMMEEGRRWRVGRHAERTTEKGRKRTKASHGWSMTWGHIVERTEATATLTFVHRDGDLDPLDFRLGRVVRLLLLRVF
jgi:hypothetical protein